MKVRKSDLSQIIVIEAKMLHMNKIGHIHMTILHHHHETGEVMTTPVITRHYLLVEITVSRICVGGAHYLKTK
ncbi:c4a0e38d-f374-4293-849e-b2c9da7adac3 [Sclerotinia trifoliorum]|uniref:C4a0e38d-f374-4293-849e-b2c9da7adac3 n=1 Tax=Sclerotinia trifoliorum TaxID=28548 RepID=A0A8H2VWD3_9HELO|nr:c4a0e38d-f374-4293-849e-b2c9da7adac3 [Sclerotinia trifoliorum]